jgi:PadR family transcriptional regulator, regulatory protein PadR
LSDDGLPEPRSCERKPTLCTLPIQLCTFRCKPGVEATMDGPLRITLNLLKVFRVLLEDPTASYYGTQIGKAARLSGGSLYPLLLRLEQAGVLASGWEDIDPSKAGRPRRRLYWLTSEGAEFARRTLAEEQRSISPGAGRLPGVPFPGGASA